MPIKRIQLESVRSITHHMLTRGMPRDILRMHPFPVGQHVLSIRSDVEGLRTKKIPRQRQLAYLEDVCERPFNNPYIMIVGSIPNDAKAKLTAAYIMEKAVNSHVRNKFPNKTRSRRLPLWHTLTGAFADDLRDNRGEENPSMLVLSNISVESSNVKIEKLRDILELFNHIPRVVVITGCDPITFVNTRLRMAINYCVHLSTAHKVEL